VLLSRARLVGIGPFDDATFTFGEADGRPRSATVVIGGPGSGKTSLLAAIASTRPGHAIAQLVGRSDAGAPGHVVSDWYLGDDDPARPHPLRVVSPNAKTDEEEDVALARRREQTLFDRRAGDGGFSFLTFSGARWFSRTPVALTTPDRTILRYDVRASASFDDASRADLTRETKQALTFAAVGAALINTDVPPPQAARLLRFQAAMIATVAAVLDGTLYAYEGIDPMRLEPVFVERSGALALFDDLPRGVRHSIAFAALSLRTLAAACPEQDPRSAEGLVLIDDGEAQQPAVQQRSLLPRLRRALPRVQWIVTTASPAVAEGCEIGEVIAVRRLPGSAKIELYDGASALLH
jgi:hypothetical protein